MMPMMRISSLSGVKVLVICALAFTIAACLESDDVVIRLEDLVSLDGFGRIYRIDSKDRDVSSLNEPQQYVQIQAVNNKRYQVVVGREDENRRFKYKDSYELALLPIATTGDTEKFLGILKLERGENAGLSTTYVELLKDSRGFFFGNITINNHGPGANEANRAAAERGVKIVRSPRGWQAFEGALNSKMLRELFQDQAFRPMILVTHKPLAPVLRIDQFANPQIEWDKRKLSIHLSYDVKTQHEILKSLVRMSLPPLLAHASHNGSEKDNDTYERHRKLANLAQALFIQQEPKANEKESSSEPEGFTGFDQLAATTMEWNPSISTGALLSQYLDMRLRKHDQNWLREKNDSYQVSYFRLQETIDSAQQYYKAAKGRIGSEKARAEKELEQMKEEVFRTQPER